MKREKLACSCRRVTYGMLYDAILAGADTPGKLQERTGMGKGCGRCGEYLELIFRDLREELIQEGKLQG